MCRTLLSCRRILLSAGSRLLVQSRDESAAPRRRLPRPISERGCLGSAPPGLPRPRKDWLPLSSLRDCFAPGGGTLRSSAASSSFAPFRPSSFTGARAFLRRPLRLVLLPAESCAPPRRRLSGRKWKFGPSARCLASAVTGGDAPDELLRRRRLSADGPPCNKNTSRCNASTRNNGIFILAAADPAQSVRNRSFGGELCAVP